MSSLKIGIKWQSQIFIELSSHHTVFSHFLFKEVCFPLQQKSYPWNQRLVVITLSHNSAIYLTNSVLCHQKTAFIPIKLVGDSVTDTVKHQRLISDSFTRLLFIKVLVVTQMNCKITMNSARRVMFCLRIYISPALSRFFQLLNGTNSEENSFHGKKQSISTNRFDHLEELIIL
jgi:hypothetical protein